MVGEGIQRPKFFRPGTSGTSAVLGFAAPPSPPPPLAPCSPPVALKCTFGVIRRCNVPQVRPPAGSPKPRRSPPRVRGGLGAAPFESDALPLEQNAPMFQRLRTPHGRVLS